MVRPGLATESPPFRSPPSVYCIFCGEYVARGRPAAASRALRAGGTLAPSPAEESSPTCLHFDRPRPARGTRRRVATCGRFSREELVLFQRDFLQQECHHQCKQANTMPMVNSRVTPAGEGMLDRIRELTEQVLGAACPNASKRSLSSSCAFEVTRACGLARRSWNALGHAARLPPRSWPAGLPASGS